MADFHQNGVITTLHNLTDRPLDAIEQDLLNFAEHRPMTLVLPCLYEELSGPALSRILDELSKVPYLTEIVIGLDRANLAEYRNALDFFSGLPQTHHVLWNDGPRLQAINQRLAKEELAPKQKGKGCNVWYCLGYVIASGQAQAVGLHDCDILTYHRSMLARLLYPVSNPAFNYSFCKGYYPRTADGKINGRVSRLLVTPLIRAVKTVVGSLEYLDYLDSFRYPLAGEFSMRINVLNDIRIPSDWGLEIGVLSELHRNYSINHICQVDIADQYEHKHQDLSYDNDQGGLSKMSIDICKAIFRKLATNGVILSSEAFRSIKASYFRIALDLVESYHNDAQINGLKLDTHQEEIAVELFAENIMKAGRTFLDNPMETPFIPSWNRVASALPDIAAQLIESVEADTQEYRC